MLCAVSRILLMLPASDSRGSTAAPRRLPPSRGITARMKKAIALGVVLVTIFHARPALPDPNPYETVLQMMAKVPEKAHGSRPGRYEQAGDAKAIARGIAAASPTLEDASLAVVFAAYESSNQLHDPTGECIGGDADPVTLQYQSWGPFQLNAKIVPKAVACDPMQAPFAWLELKAAAEKHCASNPPEDRLASLASGSCTNRGGIKESRVRVRVAEQILEAVSP